MFWVPLRRKVSKVPKIYICYCYSAKFGRYIGFTTHPFRTSRMYSLIFIEIWLYVSGGERVLKKVLYREAPSRDPTLTLLYTISSEKAPLSYTVYWKKAPLSRTFLRRLMTKSLKQEVFLSFFHVARNKLK